MIFDGAVCKMEEGRENQGARRRERTEKMKESVHHLVSSQARTNRKQHTVCLL